MKKAIYYILIVGVVALLAFLGFRIIGNNDETSGGSAEINSKRELAMGQFDG